MTERLADMTGLTPLTEIAASPDLKLISICRGGPVNVNIDAATRHGVMVSYAPGRNARATALNCASVMWCGSRPYRVRTWRAICAFIAKLSKTCLLITVE